MHSALHFYAQYVTGKHVGIQLFLARLDQLQYHFSCSDEVCFEISVLKTQVLLAVWIGVCAGGAGGL